MTTVPRTGAWSDGLAGHRVKHGGTVVLHRWNPIRSMPEPRRGGRPAEAVLRFLAAICLYRSKINLGRS